jgi:hypothetical protein
MPGQSHKQSPENKEHINTMGETMHPEDALWEAGASDGYYEIVGASYTPSDPATGTPATATIDLSTADQTGCLLKHDYSSGQTTLKWDSDQGENLYGTADDVRTAVEDITHGALDSKTLFDAFQGLMTTGVGTVDAADLAGRAL